MFSLLYLVSAVVMCCCVWLLVVCFFFFFKQKTAYEMRISDWSSDVCSSDLPRLLHCLLNRIEMVRYRLTRIVTRQVRNLALLPTGIERLVERVDDSRQSDHQ